MSLLSLYKLSDALHLPIKYSDGKVSGARSGSVTTPIPKLTLPLQLSAKAVFFSEQVGIVAHVMGHLYVMMAHNAERGGLSAFLIDIKKLGRPVTDVIAVKMTLREAVDALGSSIVQSFALHNGQWKVLKLPKGQNANNLDGGRS